MKLSELIKHVGDENIQLQWLSGSVVSAEASSDRSEITFATDYDKAIGFSVEPHSDYVGVVVWLPRNKMP